MTRSFCALMTVLLISFTARGGAPGPGGPYAVTNTFKIGGEGGFDYATLDDAGKTLYLPRTTHTQVIDTATGKVIGDIPGNSGSHGVALVPAAGRGFISNGKDGTVQLFDLKTNQSLGKIKAAEDADAIIYDPASNRVLVMCGDAGEMVAIRPDVDPASGKADAVVKLGGKPEFAVADGKGKVFINLEDKDEVAVVDTLTMKLVTTWKTAPGGKPVGMSMDRANNRLYVGCRSPRMVVMDAGDGHVLADLPIGAGVDATAFVNGTALASCGDGTLSVIRETTPGKFEVVQTVKTLERAKTMAVDATGKTIYLPTADGPRNKTVPGSFKVLVVTAKP